MCRTFPQCPCSSNSEVYSIFHTNRRLIFEKTIFCQALIGQKVFIIIIYSAAERLIANMKDNTIENSLLTFKDKLLQMKNVDGLIRNVPQYLGKFDAEKEWNDNPEDAYKKFLHTQSYCDFIDPDALILLGRTGTGKTAILRCLCENVNQHKISSYDLAIMVPFNDILDGLIRASDDFNNQNVSNQLIKVITMYVNCYIMKALISELGRTTQTSAMYSYLLNNGFYDPNDKEFSSYGISKFQKILETFAKNNGKLAEIMNGAILIADIIAAFNGYDEAYKEMINILRNKTVLVLVDTLNEYDLRDIKIVLSVKALIATCFQIYNCAAKNHVYMKISIPSEIHTHLIEMLPGKQQGNTVVIQWSNNDLIRMIAIRLLYYSIAEPHGILCFENDFYYKDFYDDNLNSLTNAKKLIQEILPDSCPTSLYYCFNTMAYCIKHTLKKPRELITIFNYFIAKLNEEHNWKFFIDHPDEIRNVVHATQEDLISQALSMYTTSYKGILDSVETILWNQKYFFKGSMLKDKLKEAVSNKQGYDADDVKRILLESGLVGKISEISYCNMNDNLKEAKPSDKTIQIIKARFEYQVKGRLRLNRDDYYVLHPMCYEHFECSVGSRTLVYPSVFADEETIKSVKLKEGTI